MSDLGLGRPGIRHAEPYGWVGLPLSLAAILVLGLLLSGAVLALAFLGDAAVVGWQAAMRQVSGIKDAAAGDPQEAEFVLLGLSILVYLTVALAVFGAARLRGGAQWRDLIAWHPWRLRQTWKLFCGTACLILVYSVAANAVLARFYPASQDWVKLPQGAWSIALFFVVATISAPLTEELVFRGWLYTALRARLRFWPSLVASSALFALAHWEATHLYALVVFPVGLALGLLRDRAGSLRASIALHALFNGVAFVMICFGQ